ncbi:hypothetical protein JCM10908_004155 [Rhodotorula pacifica]|uniref:senescence-associated domain-containing protein n=1 Tax=Rhodotorula pacifica TaxID=1495444 RepID=UPI003174D8BB
MQATPEASTPLVSVKGVNVFRLDNGQDRPLARDATVTLAMVARRGRTDAGQPRSRRRTPPPPPGQASPAAAAAAAPPPSYDDTVSSATANTSAAGSAASGGGGVQEYIQLTVTSPKQGLTIFEMPIPSSKNNSSNFVTIPPATYVIADTARSGYIKLVLPSGSAGSVDPDTRELFEAALFSTSLDGPASPPMSATPRDGITELQAERNQLYIVDEDTGRLIGQLDSHSHLEEAASLAAGQMQDAKTAQPGAGLGKLDTVDEHEAVVIDAVATTGGPTDGSGTITYTVQPASAYYRPLDNPNNSKIISTANTVSRGLVIGSELLSRQFQRGAGYYITHRPATQSPMQFSETTKGAFEKSSQWTRTATVYSGKAAGAIGNAAAKLGDRIGRKTGVQQEAGGAPPSGWKAALATTLKGLNVVADHLESSSKVVIESGTKSASQVINHSYGNEAAVLADNVGSSVKHVALVYIDARGITRRALVKGVGVGAIKARMADGSQLYLSGNDSELKQIEAAANEEAAAQGQGQGQGRKALGAAPSSLSDSKTPAAATAAGGSGTGLALPKSNSPTPPRRRTPPPPPPLPASASAAAAGTSSSGPALTSAGRSEKSPAARF